MMELSNRKDVYSVQYIKTWSKVDIAIIFNLHLNMERTSCFKKFPNFLIKKDEEKRTEEPKNH